MTNTESTLVTAPFELKVNPEYETLLIPLLPEEFELLEKDILERGQINEILAGGDGTVYDGHTRLRICKKHNMQPLYKVIDIGDDAAIKRWIIAQQLGRRNLTDAQRTVYALRHKELIAAKAKENQRAGGGAVRQKSAKPVNTRKEVAKMAGVSHDTVSKVEFIEKHADEETKEKIHNGDKSVTINKTHKKLKEELKKKNRTPSQNEAILGEGDAVQEQPELKLEQPPTALPSTPDAAAPGEPRDYEWYAHGLLECLSANANADQPTRCLTLFQDCFQLMDDQQQMRFVARFSLFLQKQGFGGDTAIDATAESI